MIEPNDRYLWSVLSAHVVLFQLARFEYVRQAKEWNIYEEDLVSQAEEIINAWEKGMEEG